MSVLTQDERFEQAQANGNKLETEHISGGSPEDSRHTIGDEKHAGTHTYIFGKWSDHPLGHVPTQGR